MELVEKNIEEHDLFELKYNEYSNVQQMIKYITDEGRNIDLVLKKHLNKNVNRDQVVLEILDVVHDINSAFLIEAGIYEYSLTYSVANRFDTPMIHAVYMDKLRNILYDIQNIQNVQNLQNELNPQELAFLDPQDINPQMWDSLIRKRQLIEYKKNNMAATDLYKCYKCNERRCQVRQVQTRSADEPMTLFITCLVCYNEFKK